jgi:hypothetical protein
VAAVKFLVSAFSYLFEGLLALFLTAIASLALASGTSLHLEMLPWTGTTLDYVLLFGGLCGILVAILAVLGKLRPLFFVWTLVVVFFMIKGYIFGGYHFDPASAKTAGYLLLAALLAVPGGWFQMFRRSDRRF